MNYLYLVPVVLVMILIANLLGSQKEKHDSQNRSYGKVSMTIAGHSVRSKGEKRIADYLYQSNITYQYEPKMYGLRPDFYLTDYDLVIEYFGMATVVGNDGKDYRKSMTKKMGIYLKKRQHILPLFSYDLNDGSYKNKIRKFVQQITN